MNRTEKESQLCGDCYDTKYGQGYFHVLSQSFLYSPVSPILSHFLPRIPVLSWTFQYTTVGSLKEKIDYSKPKTSNSI